MRQSATPLRQRGRIPGLSRFAWSQTQIGARTSGGPVTAPFSANTGNQVSSGTATLNVRAWQGMLIRPEIRYDDSSLSNAFGEKSDQVTFGLSAAYVF
jgi:hypothetical protein